LKAWTRKNNDHGAEMSGRGDDGKINFPNSSFGDKTKDSVTKRRRRRRRNNDLRRINSAARAAFECYIFTCDA